MPTLCSKVDYSPAIKKRNISEVDVDVHVNVDIADPEAANEELLMALRARILLLAGEILHLNAKECQTNHNSLYKVSMVPYISYHYQPK